MLEENQGSQEAGSAGQSEYINDAFDDYMTVPTDKSPADGEEDLENKAKKPVIEQKTEVETPEANNIAKQPEKAVEVDPFDAAFSGENGTLDLEKITSFNIGETPAVESVKLPEGSQEPEDPKTVWMREQQEAQEYENQIYSLHTSPLEKAYELIQSGVDPTQALKQVFDEQKAVADKLVNENRLNKQYEKEQSLSQKANEQRLQEEQTAKSTTNVNEIISKLPGADSKAKTELFNRVMYGKDAGAEILNDYFSEKHPDLSKKSDAEKTALADKFLKEITADKGKLQRVFNRAFNLLKAQRQPEMMKRVAQATEANVKRNALSAQKQPAGGAQRQHTPAAKDPWGSYLSGHQASAARIN